MFDIYISSSVQENGEQTLVLQEMNKEEDKNKNAVFQFIRVTRASSWLSVS